MEESTQKKLKEIRKATGTLIVTVLANATIVMAIYLLKTFDIIMAAFLIICWAAVVFWGTSVVMNTLGLMGAKSKSKVKQAIEEAQSDSNENTKELMRDSATGLSETARNAKEFQAEADRMRALEDNPEKETNLIVP